MQTCFRFAAFSILGLLFLLSPSPRTARAAEPTELASWRVTEQGIEATRLRALSGGDGVTEIVARGGSRGLTCEGGEKSRSRYVYFAAELAAEQIRGPLYVVAEYFDDLPGAILGLDYDSALGDGIADRYRRAEGRSGTWQTGSKTWRRAAFLLEQPRLAHRQNMGADFRFHGQPILREVRVVNRRPAVWEEAQRALREIRAKNPIGPGGELIVGGFDVSRVEHLNSRLQDLEASMSALRLFGVTSHEAYVRWNLCEPSPGRFDWSVYDRYVELYRRAGVKWVPFLIAGSSYSLPDWYCSSIDRQGYVCLEHGELSAVESLWNPRMRVQVARFVEAFCKHYRDSGVIESILLGVTGNYGEAIYPVSSGSDWTAEIHGEYHSHPGYWAGDSYAVESFRRFVKAKYATTDRLRAAWGSKAPELGGVKPMRRSEATNDRAWLDFVDWYIGSMNEWASFWVRETRKHFPGEIYLCTGGHAPPEHGADFGQQCKLAAACGAGVRITNEASNYGHNFTLTRWVASAGRQYGAFFSFEPASRVTPDGLVARIYNATASGARGLHYYYGNVFDSQPARDRFLEQIGQFRQRRPVVEVAVYYPETHIRLNGNKFLRQLEPLRDRFDFDFLSDQQIADGGLGTHRALVLVWGNVAEASTWQAIADWVKRGGVVLRPGDLGPLHTVEGDPWPDAALSAKGDAGRGRVLVSDDVGNSSAYRAFVARSLGSAEQLGALTRRMITLDGQEDHVFVTACEKELLWLNFTSQPVSKALPGQAKPLDLPPVAIVSQPIEAPSNR
jgi:hypothetical protein